MPGPPSATAPAFFALATRTSAGSATPFLAAVISARMEMAISAGVLLPM